MGNLRLEDLSQTPVTKTPPNFHRAGMSGSVGSEDKHHTRTSGMHSQRSPIRAPAIGTSTIHQTLGWAGESFATARKLGSIFGNGGRLPFQLQDCFLLFFPPSMINRGSV